MENYQDLQEYIRQKTSTNETDKEYFFKNTKEDQKHFSVYVARVIYFPISLFQIHIRSINL